MERLVINVEEGCFQISTHLDMFEKKSQVIQF